MSLNDEQLHELAHELTAIPGVLGVVLGGSRARGTHTPESDVDLGLYYRRSLDTDRLGRLAKALAGPSAEVTEPGGWGPWVDGGGWLRIDGTPVDWLYRDLDRLETVWADCTAGRYRFHQQTGHPLGFPDFAYVGELQLAQVLADPTGGLDAVREQTMVYPPKLSEALVDGLWEGDFLVAVARKAVSRGDSSYIAGCLFRAIGVCVHALHGAARQWLINEKGAVAAAAQIPGAPKRFRERVDEVFAGVDGDPLHLTAAIDGAADLVLDTADACARKRYEA